MEAGVASIQAAAVLTAGEEDSVVAAGMLALAVAEVPTAMAVAGLVDTVALALIGEMSSAWRLDRLRRRNEQRLATRSAFFFSDRVGMNTSPSLPLGSLKKSAVAMNPILEPSVFVDESMHGWTVVRR
jgi:hypothetical protein